MNYTIHLLTVIIRVLTIGGSLVYPFLIGLFWGTICGKYVAFSSRWLAILHGFAFEPAVLFCLFALIYLGLNTCVFKCHKILVVVCFTVIGWIWGAVHTPGQADLGGKFQIEPQSQGSQLRPLGPTMRIVLTQSCERFDDDALAEASDGTVYIVNGHIVSGHEDLLCMLGRQFRDWGGERIMRLPPDVTSWLSAFVLGSIDNLNPSFVKTCKDIGIYYLIIFGGFHVLALLQSFRLVLRVVPLMLYSVSGLSVRAWMVLWSTTDVVAVIAVGIFALLGGLPPAAHRAVIATMVSVVAPFFGIHARGLQRIPWVALFFVVIFPINPLSPTQIMSWAGSLLFLASYESNYLKSSLQVFWHGFKIQVLFSFMTLLFFGSVGTYSPIFCTLGQLLFFWIFPLDLLAMLWRSESFDQVIIWANRSFLTFINVAEKWQNSSSVPVVTLSKKWTIYGQWGHVTAIVVIGFLYALVKFKHQDASNSNSTV